MILRVLVGVILILKQSYAQSASDFPFSSTYSDCCELKLMDSNLQIAIETNRSLPVGRFTMLRTRLCSTDTIFVQIWKQINMTTFEFKWQTPLYPTQADLIKSYVVVRFDSNPVTIAAGDRLAVFNPSNSSLKLSIPYEFDAPSSSAMYFSRFRFNDSFVFTPGLLIQVEDLRWPRTFAPFLAFCSSISECPELMSDNPMSTTYNPFGSGYIPASCCAKVVACDVGNGIKDGLTNQDNQVKNLKDTVTVLQKTVENLINSQYVTGICPDGFTSGAYGIGSCYIAHRELLQMGQAVIRCRDLYSARLLNIQSANEDTFIKSFLLNASASDVERFWTSGMYNLNVNNWFWYDDDVRVKLPFGIYRNWKGGEEPAPTSILDVCSVLTTNRTSNTDYWEKATCTNLNYYVCELPKTCF